MYSNNRVRQLVDELKFCGSLRKLLQPLKTIGAVESLWTALEKRKVFLTEARLFIRRSRMRRKMECVALECWRRTVLLSEFGDRLTITFKKAGSYRELLVTSDNRHFSYSFMHHKMLSELVKLFP